MAWLRFRDGESQSLTTIVNATESLRGYRDRIARSKVGGRAVGPAAAQAFVERIVFAAYSDALHEIQAGLSARLERVIRLRQELLARVGRINELFAHGAPDRLPADLRRPALEPLLLEAERAIEALEVAAAGRKLREDAARHAKSSIDYQLDLERPHEDVEVHEGPEPTLYKPAEERPRRDPDDPDPGRQEEASPLARHAERKHYAPEDPVVRADVERAARALVGTPARRHFLPAGTEVGVVWTQPWSHGHEAALRRFEGLDPQFLGRGYELNITLPGEQAFQPDAIHFSDPQHYQFRESKEPYRWINDDTSWLDDPTVWPTGTAYDTPGGQAQIKAMLERDARLAKRLAGHGFTGFVYETGHPKLDDFIGQVIQRLRGDPTLGPGARLMFAPKGGDP